MKNARITYHYTEYGCQIIDDKLSNWSSGGTRTVNIPFTPSVKLTDKVVAMKEFWNTLANPVASNVARGNINIVNVEIL